jgi:phospholipid-binding lipoprotein MlaA
MPVFAVAIFAGCSVAPAGTDIHDPYESVNRQIHEFNREFDRTVLDPAGEAVNLLPDIVKYGVINFSNNAGLPNAAANGLLQGNFEGAARNSLRFIINTTIGILGVFDPAGKIGIPEVDTDFGETLAVWGVPEGAYMELPGLGPSTERDTAGFIVDLFLDPFQIFGIQPPLNETTVELFETDTIAEFAELVVERGLYDSTFDSVYESADSYSQLRLIYLQNRRFELRDSDVTAVRPTEEEYYFDPYQDLQ